MEEQLQETQKIEMKADYKLGINFKIFDLWDISEIQITDPGLVSAINLEPRLALKTHGRNVVKHGQTKVNVVERLMNKLALAGHRNKKHKVELGHSTGKYSKNMKTVVDALKIIEKRTNTNPVQILVKAIEKASPRDEVTIIEYGGARYPQAVDVSPIRRVNLALKWMVHGASDKAFGKKKKLSQALAEEIIMASEENGESFAFKKKKEAEAQADSAR
jgi:small subunit ribosomal protein S7